jgi:hypothetical protein
VENTEDREKGLASPIFRRFAGREDAELGTDVDGI